MKAVNHGPQSQRCEKCNEYAWNCRCSLAKTVAAGHASKAVSVRCTELARLHRLHSLKTWPAYWVEVAAGRKTFEARKDDRGYAVGDVLWLREWSPDNKQYTGREVWRVVTYILRDPAFGVVGGWCVMALQPMSASEVQPSQ